MVPPPKSSNTGTGQDCKISIQAFPGGPMFKNLLSHSFLQIMSLYNSDLLSGTLIKSFLILI